MLEISKSCHACADRDDIEIRDLVILFLHLVTTVAKLYGRGGERSVVAESVLLKHQLLIVGPEYWAPIEFSVINIVNSAGFHDPLNNSTPSVRSINSLSLLISRAYSAIRHPQAPRATSDAGPVYGSRSPPLAATQCAMSLPIFAAR